MDNVHPGDILRHDFLVGSDVPTAEVARATGVSADTLVAIMDRRASVDANVGLRLSRYFGMNDGFFVGLQLDYDVEEELRAHGGELDRIVRRAA